VAERRPSSLMASKDPSRALIQRARPAAPPAAKVARSTNVRIPDGICIQYLPLAGPAAGSVVPERERAGGKDRQRLQRITAVVDNQVELKA